MSTVKINVKSRFMLIPVSDYVPPREVVLYKDGEIVHNFSLRLDSVNPIKYVVVTMGNFIGDTLDAEVFPGDVQFSCEFHDGDDANISRLDFYRNSHSRFRPAVHFTPLFGWLNDPNGLLKYTSPVTGKTTYHMFFQHNPYDWVWGNMHWGHTVSEDLFHWEEREIALAPDKHGTMFSGSAIVDYDNRTGLKDGEEDVILLYYTCAGGTQIQSRGEKFTQCMAYSTDGGVTFKKYEKNPVIGHIVGENRDPKVIFCEELDKFVLSLYLDGCTYALFTSENLLDWEMLQKIDIPGEDECPDFYPLWVDSDGKKVKKWVLSGASQFYVVGDIEGGKFVPCQQPKRLGFGFCSYAPQTFYVRDNDERIQIAWNRDVNFPASSFRSQMSVPYSMSLEEDGGEFWLTADLIDSMKPMYRDEQSLENVAVPFSCPISMSDRQIARQAYEIELVCAADSPDFKLSTLGKEIAVRVSEKSVQLDGQEMPLIFGKSGEITLKIVYDTCSIEIFAGKSMITMPVNSGIDYNRKSISLTPIDGSSVREGKNLLKKMIIRRIEL